MTRAARLNSLGVNLGAAGGWEFVRGAARVQTTRSGRTRRAARPARSCRAARSPFYRILAVRNGGVEIWKMKTVVWQQSRLLTLRVWKMRLIFFKFFFYSYLSTLSTRDAEFYLFFLYQRKSDNRQCCARTWRNTFGTREYIIRAHRVHRTPYAPSRRLNIFFLS